MILDIYMVHHEQVSIKIKIENLKVILQMKHCYGHFKVFLMTEIRRVWKMKFTSKSINWQIKIFTVTRFNFYLKILSINSFADP